MPCPGAERSRLPIFDGLYAIIGDDQSVAENLSTFSAFVKQVRQVLDEADARSLVLLDELGAGTDPDEGAALAQAILEELAERGALVVATTHLEPLRGFASTHPRARNASVEFDAATLAPTFRLVYDRPGQSWALAIAARSGSRRGSSPSRGPSLRAGASRVRALAQLDARNRSEAERARELDRREAANAARLTAAQRDEQRRQTRARTTLERAKAEAAGAPGRHPAHGGGPSGSAEAHRALAANPAGDPPRLQEVSARVAPTPAPVLASDTPLAAGMAVAAEHLGLKGELVAVTGDYATVRSGTLTVRVPVGALRRVEATANGAPNGRRPALGKPAAGAADESRTIGRELLLLGKTSDEARELVEKYLDDAFMLDLPTSA